MQPHTHSIRQLYLCDKERNIQLISSSHNKVIHYYSGIRETIAIFLCSLDITFNYHKSNCSLVYTKLACVAVERNPGIVRLRISDQKLVPPPGVLPGFSMIDLYWLLHMAVLSWTVIGRVDLEEP